MAGYSGTPLAKKLGIADQPRLVVIGAPWDYSSMVGIEDGEGRVASRLARSERFIHRFASRANELAQFEMLALALADDGILWISWPKKASGMTSDLSEELIRQAGLKAGLVDVKVCAVDETWSGLKFVRRLKDRKSSR